MAKKKSSIEDKLNELEAIVEQFEEKELDLDDSLKNFENGVKLYKECRKLLGEAEKKIKVLTDSLSEEED